MAGKKRVPRKKKKEISVKFGPFTFDLSDIGRIVFPILQNTLASKSTPITGKIYAGMKKDPEVIDVEAEIISSKIKQ